MGQPRRLANRDPERSLAPGAGLGDQGGRQPRRASRPAPPPDGEPGRRRTTTLARRRARRRELRRRRCAAPTAASRSATRPPTGWPSWRWTSTATCWRGSPLARRWCGAGASSLPGRLNVLAPSAWLLRADPLPHSWDITSDSIAAWIARVLGARRLMLVKHEDGFIGPDCGPESMSSAPATDRARCVRGRGGPVLRPGARPRHRVLVRSRPLAAPDCALDRDQRDAGRRGRCAPGPLTARRPDRGLPLRSRSPRGRSERTPALTRNRTLATGHRGARAPTAGSGRRHRLPALTGGGGDTGRGEWRAGLERELRLSVDVDQHRVRDVPDVERLHEREL